MSSSLKVVSMLQNSQLVKYIKRKKIICGTSFRSLWKENVEKLEERRSRLKNIMN